MRHDLGIDRIRRQLLGAQQERCERARLELGQPLALLVLASRLGRSTAGSDHPRWTFADAQMPTAAAKMCLVAQP